MHHCQCRPRYFGCARLSVLVEIVILLAPSPLSAFSIIRVYILRNSIYTHSPVLCVPTERVIVVLLWLHSARPVAAGSQQGP